VFLLLQLDSWVNSIKVLGGMQLAFQALESEDVRQRKSQQHLDYQAALGRKQKSRRNLSTPSLQVFDLSRTHFFLEVAGDGTVSTISNPVNVQHLTTVTKDFKWTGGEPEDMFDFVEVIGQGYVTRRN